MCNGWVAPQFQWSMVESSVKSETFRPKKSTAVPLWYIKYSTSRGGLCSKPPSLVLWAWLASVFVLRLTRDGIIRVLAITVFAIYHTTLCWVAKHINIIMKPSNSPTQGQPNPRKKRLNLACGPLFPTAIFFSWVGIDFT